MIRRLSCAIGALIFGSATEAATVTKSYTTELSFSSGPVTSVTQSFTVTYDPLDSAAFSTPNGYIVSDYYSSSDNPAFAAIGSISAYPDALGSTRILRFSRSGGVGVFSNTDDFAVNFRIDDAGNIFNGVAGGIYENASGGGLKFASMGRVVAGLVDLNSAVPEPATWAMMLVGFGLIGGTLRRRKVSLSFG